MMNNHLKVKEVINQFDFSGELFTIEPFGSGHINDTYLVKFKIKHMGIVPVILQRMNTKIFINPEQLMENILNVTAFLRKKIIENGGDPERETLTVILAKDGKPYCKDSDGDYWRAYHFIVGATGYDEVRTEEDFYQMGYEIGRDYQKINQNRKKDPLLKEALDREIMKNEKILVNLQASSNTETEIKNTENKLNKLKEMRGEI